MSGSTSDNALEMRLLGERIRLRTPGEDPELVRSIVELVNLKIREAEGRTTSQNPVKHHVVLLALLDLAQDYVNARRLTATHLQAVDEKARELRTLIEADFT